MGAMRKMGEYLGLVEHGEFADDLDATKPEQAEPRRAPESVQAAPASATAAPARVSRLDDRRPTPVRSQPSAEAVVRIETVVPTTYNDARRIGDNFRDGIPVIMNLSEISEDEAKRLVDFAAGLVFAVYGNLTRITAKVFLLTPENIEVTDEDKKRLAADDGLYDQA